MGNTSNDKNHKSNQINNNSLKNNHKKQKNYVTQPLQSLEKTSLIDILFKKFQPSLFEREWIINQRHISSITSTKGKFVCTNSFLTF